MTHETFVSKKNLQDILDGIEQKIAGLGSTLTGIYTWQANNQYKTGDVCILNGSLFICLATHTSSPAFSTDIANWNLVYSDIDEWASSTYYVAGASVIANNAMYKCKTTHTSGSTFDSTEEANWDVVVGTSGNVKIKNWATSTQYKQYDVVMVNNNLYRCVSNHTSTTFSSDISNWELIYASIGNWQASTYYPIGVFAINDKKLYRCKTQHTSGLAFSDTNWVLIAGGGGIETWVASKAYAVGSLVLYNDRIYKCVTANNDSSFTASNWKEVSGNVLEQWTTSTGYIKNQVVENGNNMYMCLSAHTSGTFNTDCSNGKWCKVNVGVETWASSVYYPLNSIVYDVTSNCFYVCKSAHVSSSSFSTDVLAGKWAILGKEGVNNVSQTSLYTGTVGHNVGDFNITMSDDINNYDYLLIKHGKYSSATATLMPVDTRLFTAGAGYFISYFYGSTNNYAGWVVATSNTVLNFHISNSTDTVNIVPMEVIGIKFNAKSLTEIANAAMPSDKYVSIPSITSGTIYTAPANGLVYVEASVSTTSWVRLDLDILDSSNNLLRQERAFNYGEAHGMDCSILVQKGAKVRITLPTTATNVVGKFFYTVGDAKDAGLL